MGICGCKKNQIEIEKTHEAFFETEPKVVKRIIPMKSNIANSENKFKQNFDNEKLSEFGTYIPEDELNYLIKDNIKEYMNNIKLDIPDSYKEQINTFQLEPLKFKNGNIYYGEWNEFFEMEGYGKYYLREKNLLIEGIWRHGKVVYGRIFKKNDDIYIGEINNSEFHGKGKYLSANGDIYEGDFFRGQKSGEGKYKFKDGTIYQGMVSNGYFTGIGKLKWKNIEYEGKFNNSTIDGKGILINEIGDKYEGNFNNNNFNGNGCYIFKNGEKYEGEFKNGEMDGIGKFNREDGICFEGIFKNDLPNGKGKIFFLNNILEAKYQNGTVIDGPRVLEGNVGNSEKFNFNIFPGKPFISNCKIPHLIYKNLNQMDDF